LTPAIAGASFGAMTKLNSAFAVALVALFAAVPALASSASPQCGGGEKVDKPAPKPPAPSLR
jgi:hypothetical protein